MERTSDPGNEPASKGNLSEPLLGMSDFLSRLVRRTISDRSMLIPRRESVFEQAIEHWEPMQRSSVPAFKDKEPVRPNAPRKNENTPLQKNAQDTVEVSNEVLDVPEIDVEQPVDLEPQNLDTQPRAQEQQTDTSASMQSVQAERPAEERNEEDVTIEREREAPSIEKKEPQPESLIERIPVVVEKESSQTVFITRERRETIREKLETRDREPSITVHPSEKTNTPIVSYAAQEAEDASDIPPAEVETLEAIVEDSSENRDSRRSVEKPKARQSAAPVSSVRQNETFSAPEFSTNRQSRNSRTTTQPLIEISIGSIDIKAENRVVKKQIPVRSKPTPRMGIDDYLKKRRESLK